MEVLIGNRLDMGRLVQVQEEILTSEKLSIEEMDAL